LVTAVNSAGSPNAWLLRWIVVGLAGVAHGQSPKLLYLATIGLLTIPERKIPCFILRGEGLGGKLHEHSDFFG
jgi:hypothetical protein